MVRRVSFNASPRVLDLLQLMEDVLGKTIARKVAVQQKYGEQERDKDGQQG